MKNKNSANSILYWAKRAYNAKMVPGTSGNISIKDKDTVYLSASGVCLGDMEKTDLAKISLSGDMLNKVKPSSEKLMHLEIYNKRPDIEAIIHIHCPYVTSFAVCHKEMNEPILPEFIYNFGTAQAGEALAVELCKAELLQITSSPCGTKTENDELSNKALRGIPSAQYALPSSKELANEIGRYFKEGHNAVLMQNHGLVAGAKTLKEAFYTLESIQAYAKTYFAAKFLGEINTLNQDEVDKIKALKH